MRRKRGPKPVKHVYVIADDDKYNLPLLITTDIKAAADYLCCNIKYLQEIFNRKKKAEVKIKKYLVTRIE